MKIGYLVLVSLLLLAGCGEFQFDWRQSVHESLANMCDTQPNCDH
ncbi:MAG TPA: hypothetical protein VM639_23965 [Dongiaceae bacterium]|nr:hypothetical protein [Dongiaceae bacterium]